MAQAFIINQFDKIVGIIGDAAIIQAVDYSLNGGRFTTGKQVLVGRVVDGEIRNGITLRYSIAQKYAARRQEVAQAPFAAARNVNGMQIFEL